MRKTDGLLIGTSLVATMSMLEGMALPASALAKGYTPDAILQEVTEEPTLYGPPPVDETEKRNDEVLMALGIGTAAVVLASTAVVMHKVTTRRQRPSEDDDAEGIETDSHDPIQTDLEVPDEPSQPDSAQQNPDGE